MTKPALDPATHDVLDPVCGKPVDPLRARAVGIYAGVTRYFCSQACKAKFADPRVTAGTGPDGVERRWKAEPPAMSSMPASNSNEWFVKGETDSNVPAARAPERFEDLEGRPSVSAEMPPTASLMIEVQASRRGAAPWVWLALAVAAGVVLAFLGLR